MNPCRRFWVIAVISGFPLIFLPVAALGVTPEIFHPADRDVDTNGIEDMLETKVTEAFDKGTSRIPIRITVTLYRPPREEDLTLFRQMEGDLKFRYEHATYGFAGVIPADRISDLAEALGEALCIIEADVQGAGTLDDSARQCRIRAIVWHPITGYGLDGDPSTTIAIFDTGIDETHTDLSGGKVVLWQDFTTEAEPTSTDRNGHGSHVSGIAAGTGAASGSGAITSLTTTMSGRLPTTPTWGYVDMIKVPVLGAGSVTSNLLWQGSGTGLVNLATSGTPPPVVWSGSVTGSSTPLVANWTITATDVYKAFAGNQSGLGAAPFSMLVTYPYTSVGDGFTLFGGIAPGCKLACPKILYQNATGWAAEWTAAFDFVVTVNSLYNIKVANASVNLSNGATNTALRTAVNSLVSAGTVVVVSAGNAYPGFKIADPGLAGKAITVGAINDFGAMTHYSSNGPSGSSKPDVVAPGGSHSWTSNVGSRITSVDTNVNDAYKTGFADRQANDYCNMFGTSMAAPCVAGLAALMIEAWENAGNTWSYDAATSLWIKMLIQMTATETNALGEESCRNDPPLDRGGKDRVEGYGKINGDAAIETIVNWLLISQDTLSISENVTFGSGVFGRKCWASRISMCWGEIVDVSMSVPAGADYDLYLYRPSPTASGDPQIADSSTQAGLGVNEQIIVPLGAGEEDYYLVAKRVSGTGTATINIQAHPAFEVAAVDLLHDTFHDSLPAYNSHLDAYDVDTLTYYSGPPYVNPLPKHSRLYAEVCDKDRIQQIRVYGSSDRGQTWVWVQMAQNVPFDPTSPSFGGEYAGTFYPTDFSLQRWNKGTEIYYYLTCTDQAVNTEYFPVTANPSHPDHTDTGDDYFSFSVMPMYPVTYPAVKLLLVDGHQQDAYDWAPCLHDLNNTVSLSKIYGQVLADAGYCYDRFDINAPGGNIHIHPLHYAYYDCVIWFTGPDLSAHLFDGEAQEAIRDYLSAGGRAVLCGDRIAYNMAVVGEDLLGGEFLGGIMGCTYQAEMEPAASKPYVYLEAADIVYVFGCPVLINPCYLDTSLLYRDSPAVKEMSYVLANSSPPAGYTAQPLLHVLNPNPVYDPADGAIYIERPAEGGQCVFVDFDLCAMVNHEAGHCDGITPEPAPDFQAGVYDGRVELMRTILEDLFGLPPTFPGGGGGTSRTETELACQWMLSQNTPNPCVGGTDIRFEVARTAHVSIKIYDVMGQTVHTLISERKLPGRYSVRWDGVNSVGERVSSGLYFYRMQADRFRATKKMIVLE